MDWDDNPIINLADYDIEESDEHLAREAGTRLEVGKIVKQFGTWAVTEYGLECLAHYYPIDRERIFSKDKATWDWPRHMSTKRWIDMSDFLDAYASAREYHRDAIGQPKGRMPARRSAKSARSGMTPSLRFEVMRRDGFRCCLCGKTADEGATLEVDHRIAVSNGGPTIEPNLWTLCFTCNRGKAARDL